MVKTVLSLVKKSHFAASAKCWFLVLFSLYIASPSVQFNAQAQTKPQAGSSIEQNIDHTVLPEPLTAADFLPFSEQNAALGQLLFYDPILSGNRNIACATCHHPDHGTSDGLSLGIGEGGEGLGNERTPGNGASAATRRIQRNSPALFNLGFRNINTLFHDGRLSIDENDPTGFNSPAVEFLPKDLNSIIAAQALFPLTSTVEMAGNVNENEVAGAKNTRIDYGWRILTERISHNQVYLAKFSAIYPTIQQPSDLNISHIVNALGDFINAEWRTLGSRFDDYLAGNKTALSAAELAGMQLFYGKARCSSCHSGKLLSDQQFHSIGLPQFGPGRTRTFDFKARDMGRINETDHPEDIYRFRTPSLRNVTLTAPYGHNGAYKNLTDIIRHHLQPKQALANWHPQQLVFPTFASAEASDFIIQQDQQELTRLLNSIDIKEQDLSEQEIDQLLAFLDTLTDQSSLSAGLGIPDSVPSGLAVPR